MYSQVDALIFNAIAVGQCVFLPEVGSICVARHPSSFRSSSEIVPPFHTFSFTTVQRGTSVTELISHAAHVDDSRAQEIYAEWKQHATDKDGMVRIGGVGRVEKGKFIPTVELKKTLDPSFSTIIRVHRRRKSWPYIVIVLIVVLAGAIVVFLPDLKKMAQGTQPAYAASSEESIPCEPTSIETENVVINADSVDTEGNIRPDTVQIAEHSRDAQAAPKNDAEEPQVGELAAGRSYLVLGVFREKVNADAEMARILDIYPEAVIARYRFGNKMMLTIFESDSVQECSTMSHKLKDLHPAFENIWIYTR